MTGNEIAVLIYYYNYSLLLTNCFGSISNSHHLLSNCVRVGRRIGVSEQIEYLNAFIVFRCGAAAVASAIATKTMVPATATATLLFSAAEKLNMNYTCFDYQTILHEHAHAFFCPQNERKERHSKSKLSNHSFASHLTSEKTIATNVHAKLNCVPCMAFHWRAFHCLCVHARARHVCV